MGENDREGKDVGENGRWEGKKEREAVPGQTQQSGESEEKMTKWNNEEEEDSQERSGSW